MNRIFYFFTGNMVLKLISLGIAFLLWVIILGSQKIEADKEVPLKVLTSDEVIPANDVPETVTFRISGPKGFVKQVLDRAESPIEVNLEKSQPGLVTYRFFSDDMNVPLGVKVLSINPTAVFVRLEKVQTKSVNVHPELIGELPEGYRLKRVEVDPPTVLVKGAESRIEKITEVSTLPINLADAVESIEQLAELDLAQNNLALAGDPPRIMVEIEAVAANYKIKNVQVRVTSVHQARLSDETVTLFVRARPAALKALDESKISATVNLIGKPKGRYTSKLSVQLPKNISLVRVVPENVKVTLY